DPPSSGFFLQLVCFPTRRSSDLARLNMIHFTCLFWNYYLPSFSYLHNTKKLLPLRSKMIYFFFTHIIGHLIQSHLKDFTERFAFINIRQGFSAFPFCNGLS